MKKIIFAILVLVSFKSFAQDTIKIKYKVPAPVIIDTANKWVQSVGLSTLGDSQIVVKDGNRTAIKIAGGSSSYWAVSGSDIYNNNAGSVQISSGSNLAFLNPTGNKSFKITSTGVATNFAAATLLPTTGTNVGMAVYLSPKGTGFSANIKASLGVYNTDISVDPINYEVAALRSTGSDGFAIVTSKAGTGTVRPLFIDATGGQDISTANMLFRVDGGITLRATNAGSTGAQTINKPTGSVQFAAGTSTLVVTNSLVTTSSNIFVQVEGTDATAISARVTKAAGSFTITLNAAATAITKVSFWVIN